jgi:hypothetical protein
VAAGRPEVARDAYRLLSELLMHADGDMPEAVEAKEFLSSRAGQPGG